MCPGLENGAPVALWNEKALQPAKIIEPEFQAGASSALEQKLAGKQLGKMKKFTEDGRDQGDRSKSL